MTKLYFKYGVMGSAKSAELLIKAYQLEERDIPVLLIKPAIDTREGDNKDGEGIIRSRAGLEKKCLVVDDKLDLFEWLNDTYTPGHWILVDEAQFLTPAQVEQLGRLVDELDVNVICYGLRTDFQTHLFPGSKRLLELADDIEELKCLCSCGKKAIINGRFVDGKLVNKGEQIMIGDSEYKSICRKCYNKMIKETE